MPPIKKRKATPEGRAEQFGEKVHVVDNVLFCTACSISLQVDKVDSIKSHFLSNRHLVRENAPGRRLIQLPINSSLNLRNEFSRDFVKLLAQAGIPLHRLVLPKFFVSLFIFLQGHPSLGSS